MADIHLFIWQGLWYDYKTKCDLICLFDEDKNQQKEHLLRRLLLPKDLNLYYIETKRHLNLEIYQIQLVLKLSTWLNGY